MSDGLSELEQLRVENADLRKLLASYKDLVDAQRTVIANYKQLVSAHELKCKALEIRSAVSRGQSDG